MLQGVQLHFFSFLVMIPLPDTFLSWDIWSYFLLSIPVLTWPRPLNQAPKPRSCLTHKLLRTAQDFPDSNVHIYMCISKKTTLNANFPKPFDDSNRKWDCKC